MGREELPREVRFSINGVIMLINAGLFYTLGQQCLAQETK
jgi:hypothetical protein